MSVSSASRILWMEVMALHAEQQSGTQSLRRTDDFAISSCSTLLQVQKTNPKNVLKRRTLYVCKPYISRNFIRHIYYETITITIRIRSFDLNCINTSYGTVH